MQTAAANKGLRGKHPPCYSLKQGVCIAALHAVGAFTLASVGADAAAVVIPLWVPPASTLVVVGIGTSTPCRKKHMQQSTSQRRETLSFACKPVGMRLLGQQ